MRPGILYEQVCLFSVSCPLVYNAFIAYIFYLPLSHSLILLYLLSLLQRCLIFVFVLLARPSQEVVPTQCDQIGRLLKLQGDKKFTKVAKMIGNFLGYFEKPDSYVNTAASTFWTTFGENWATVYSNIWSHCL